MRLDIRQNTRVVVNSVMLYSAAATTSVDSHGRALLAYSSTFEILDKMLLQLADRVVVILDEFWQLSDLSTNVDAGSGVRHPDRFEDILYAFVTLLLLFNV